MTELINLANHSLTQERKSADHYARNCNLIKGSLGMCTGYDLPLGIFECDICEVPRFYKEVQQALSKIKLEGFI